MNSSLKKYTVVTTRVNSQKSRNFQYKLSSYCMTQHLSNSVHYKKGFLSNKVDGISKWFDEFTGMHEVRIAQSRVLNEEQNFRKSQEVRRNVLGELNEIQKKIKDVYAELETINRTDEKYVTLVALEHKLLKEEKSALVSKHFLISLS